MLDFTSAFVLSILAFSSVVKAQNMVAISWNSTSPYGQSQGNFSLVESTYGYAMTFSDSTSNLTGIYSEEFGSVVQHCPVIGYVAALIPVAGITPATYVLQWVDPTTSLPEGSSTTSIVPATGGFVSTLGSGIFTEVEVGGSPVFAWVEETAEEHGDVQAWIDTTPITSDACS
ncbi:hypothetical protein BT96DRAFT_923123 [Gymnopus androsaceus JB14]|uniref:Uncharacterized protein n=1 Tax=Gymnopus androsaceus JB14 TaxID=1447944 RepID=A0A6A4HCH0_9AGAR|nr:hypothetical protein BT96DRAFT_923123 [Gymnopus androsaceus JB14]